MYANLTTEKLKKEKIDEAVDAWRELIEGASPKGLKTADYLVDRETGDAVVVAFWETEADARALEESGRFEELVEKFKPYLEGTSERKIYEVAAHVSG